MNRRPTKTNIAVASIAALIAAFALSGLRAAPPQADAPTPATTQTGDNAALSLKGYRKWARVNPKPVPIFSEVALLCGIPSPQQLAQIRDEEAKNSHLDTSPHAPRDRTRYATIYVNALGADAMLKEKNPAFPVGSVIVKEKLATPTSDAPELLTVMRKREKGYNPTGGDWEYLVFDGKGAKVQAQGRLETCESCHERMNETDYVARTYLPDEVSKYLK